MRSVEKVQIEFSCKNRPVISGGGEIALQSPKNTPPGAPTSHPQRPTIVILRSSDSLDKAKYFSEVILKRIFISPFHHIPSIMSL